MTPPSTATLALPAPSGLELFATLNTLPPNEARAFWSAVVKSQRNASPFLSQPRSYSRQSLFSGMSAATRGSRRLDDFSAARKLKPRTRTNFFSLPAELRQKILLSTYETHKLYYILHSPTRKIDWIPSLNKHMKKWSKASRALYGLHRSVDPSSRHGLFQDICYVQKVWRDELATMEKLWRDMEGCSDPEDEEDGYDSDESDDEEGRMYFDCVESQIVDG
ncbi:hypothetical protein FKW77_001882 [Venturia effusa]|uniref:Uncharacterized protein n=1 Tax=Venturia effusa TaxID=50376 RepID=A0A517L2T3_9PEZI|nr:hypothetical protein FKW77_001882 [Venturia effusa]